MPAGFIALLSFAILATACAVTQQPIVYEISVRDSGSPLRTVELELNPFETRRMDLTDSLQIELVAAASADDPGQTTIRLWRSPEAELALLHSARQSGALGSSRRIAYLVCANGITFLSPAPRHLPECPG